MPFLVSTPQLKRSRKRSEPDQPVRPSTAATMRRLAIGYRWMAWRALRKGQHAKAAYASACSRALREVVDRRY